MGNAHAYTIDHLAHATIALVVEASMADVSCSTRVGSHVVDIMFVGMAQLDYILVQFFNFLSVDWKFIAS